MIHRVLILVEGQTEERFVKQLLVPTFSARNFDLRPIILETKKVKDGKNFKGGVTNFAKFEDHIKRLLFNAGGALVTTMMDYYGLPDDFPGILTKSRSGAPIDRVRHVESEIAKHFGAPRHFLPYLSLHEFEALLFASPDELPKAMSSMDKSSRFEAIRNQFSTPEDINDRQDLAPSRRILNLFPEYRKALHGPIVSQRIGLRRMRDECPHFSEWVDRIEHFFESP